MQIYDVVKLIAQQENENTNKKFMYDLNILLKFLREVRKEKRELEKIPPDELNAYLSEFIIAARTKTSNQYEPSSPRGILSSVDRYLTRHEYRKRLFIDAEFTRLRDALKVKQKELKKQGRGNKLNATTALPDEEIDTLLEKKKSLGNKFSTIATEHCVAEKYHTIRSQRLHKRTKFAMGRWSDSRGKEYLVYTENKLRADRATTHGMSGQ